MNPRQTIFSQLMEVVLIWANLRIAYDNYLEKLNVDLPLYLSGNYKLRGRDRVDVGLLNQELLPSFCSEFLILTLGLLDKAFAPQPMMHKRLYQCSSLREKHRS